MSRRNVLLLSLLILVFAFATLLAYSICNFDTKSKLNFLSQENSTDQQINNYSGTYSLSRPNGAGCTLKILHNFLKGLFEEADIELLCNRGAPSYNSGYALATIRIAGDVGVYSYDSQFAEDECYIVFEFQGNEISVTQIGQGSECGFGHAVFSDGIYHLINDKSPVLGCMRMDNPCELEVAP